MPVTNVKSFRSKRSEPFPTLWPERSIGEMLAVAGNNIPKGSSQSYVFDILEDVSGTPSTVIVAAGQPPMYLSDDSAFARWFSSHGQTFASAALAGHSGSFVGKLTPLGVFYVFYVAAGGLVFADADTIRTALCLQQNPTMWVTPAHYTGSVEVTLDKSAAMHDEAATRLRGQCVLPSIGIPSHGKASDDVGISVNQVRFLSFVDGGSA